MFWVSGRSSEGGAVGAAASGDRLGHASAKPGTRNVERLAPRGPLPAVALAKAGFTVLELLVATAILSVIVTLLFTIFDRASNAWIKGEATVDRQRSARTTLELLNREMSQAFIATNSSGPIVFVGNTNWVYFVAPVAPASDMFSDLGEFSYVYSASPGGGTLTRYYSAPTDANSSAGTYGPAGRSVTPVTPITTLASLSQLTEAAVYFNVTYYDAGGNGTNIWNSSASGPVDQRGVLPSLIEVTLVAVDSRTASHLPLVDPARANAIAQYGRTNSAIIRLQNAQ